MHKPRQINPDTAEAFLYEKRLDIPELFLEGEGIIIIISLKTAPGIIAMSGNRGEVSCLQTGDRSRVEKKGVPAL